ncbi:MAG: GerMN domain-containing protein [Microthrixaceae bacterium]|nr:GerMN domain-containing protein [Acidimicrobiales bacterium]MCB9403512.1 GerMN domain-containing protein [Microthrixaceae bacterium]
MIPSRPPAADVTPRPTGAHLRRARRVTAVGLLAATLVLGGCGSDDGDKADSTAPGTASSTTAAGSTTTAAGGSTSSSEPASQSDVTVYFVRDEKIAATTRSVTGVGIGAAALEAVIAGPNEVESGIGFSNAVPAGTEVLGVNIADGVATVDLSAGFESGGGSLSMQLRVAQVVATLTQFDTVSSVTIRIDGKEVDGIGGEGVPATDLDRLDIEDVTPAILLLSPTPGATITSPLRISGTSNTFEATYQYEVLDENGKVIASGFDTATSGTGTRGTFEAEIDLDGHIGDTTVVLFESSAKDGSRINEVEIPIDVVGGL